MLNTQFAKVEQTIDELVSNCYKGEHYMELNNKKWENYSTPFVDSCKKSSMDQGRELPDYAKLRTFSLGELKEKIDWMIHNEELNHKDIYEVPVFIKYDSDIYLIEEASSGSNYCSLGTDKSSKMIFTAPDKRPEIGEYWTSRGCSTFDCSGFVVSKLSGERLLRLVKYVLETDKPESWLDFREHDPNWIQFKFSNKEFDIEKLDSLSREIGGIVTEDILRKCKIK